MKFCAADAGILTFLATLFTSISPIFAQSPVNDTLAVKAGERQLPIDFEHVAKQLTSLSKPTIALPQQNADSLSKRLGDRLKKDLKGTHGHVDLSYAYGLNTVFIDTSRSIGTIMRTSGDFSTSVLSLPLQLSFNYSSLKVPLGTNNYFRISLDRTRTIEQQKQKLTASIADLEAQQQKLDQKRAELNGIMGYMEVCLDALRRRAEWEARKRGANAGGLSAGIADSLRVRAPDSASLQNPIDYQYYYDSLQTIYHRALSIKQSYDSLTTTIASSKEKLTSSLGQLSGADIPSKAPGKIAFLRDLRTLDIGLSYPKTTGLSSQNVPIKGLNVAIQHESYYLSVATGLTLNNIMLSTNEVQNQLNYSQNVFNNFDFQQLKKNGWITAIKTGFGTPDGTHAFVGFNYITNTKFLDAAALAQSGAAYDPAASLELDLRYTPKFIKGSALDLVYGKTSANAQLDTATARGVFPSLFSSYPSHVFLGRYAQNLQWLRSDFSATYRRLDAFANTSTFGTMQPNNERLELKTNHRISKFVKLSLLYRMDATLRSISGMNMLRLNMAGLTLSGAYSRYLSYAVFFNDVFYTLRMPNAAGASKGTNYLIGLNLGSNYETGRATANTTLAYNEYLLTDTSGLNKYSQFGLSQSFAEKRYSVAVSYDYFYRSVDGVGSGTSVFGLSGKYLMQKCRLSAGLKLANGSMSAPSLGGHLEGLWSAAKFLDVTMRAERFVLGDFYRNYYRAQYEQFPYLITIQTTFKI